MPDRTGRRLRQPGLNGPRPGNWRRRTDSARSITCNARLERYLGAGQGAGDRAVLCLLGQILEGGLVNAGHVADRTELDAGDVEPGADLSERDPGGGAQVPRRMTRLAKQVRQRHREAGGFGRAEQLLRVRDRPGLRNACPQRIRPVESAAAERYPAATLRQCSLPAGLGAAHDAEAQGALLGLARDCLGSPLTVPVPSYQAL